MKNNNRKQIVIRTIILVLFIHFAIAANAQVNYDEGRMVINGVQLLQNSNEPNTYHYLPKYPRLATKDDGDFELMCMKYIGQGGNASGGLFHTLIQFDLPDDELKDLEEELKEKKGGAKIAGPVPLKQVLKDGEDGIASFKIVSSILNNVDGDNPFTQNVITSGHAPLYKNSKAAIAAKLSQEGATLLWESLQGKTSDVSVVVSGFYEAKVKGYNAVVTADMSTIYDHYSKVYSNQQGYTKRQMRKITDEMVQDQKLNIDVFDRSQGLGIKTDDMNSILSLVTDKLIELMFDAEMGWAKQPEKETAVEQGQLLGRRKRGFFSKVFGGARDEKYVTDNQFVLKKRTDIKINKFYLNLSKSTTIKVPVYSSGNISGLYEVFKEDPASKDKYFRVVNLEDSDFLKREIVFQLDGEYVDSFSEILNSVSVSFKKHYGEDHNDVTRDVVIQRSDLEAGKDYKNIFYPRLGITGADWLDYEYKLSWNLKGDDKAIKLPKAKDGWLKTNEASIALTPPFTKRVVQIDADRTFFKDADIQACSVRFFTILNGQPKPQGTVVLRQGDTENTTTINLYHDKEEPVVYQVSWYSKTGPTELNPKPLEGNYLFLLPPVKE
ncbi:hypothetical protein [Hyunsoonleella pacifica]|uniref:Uncharacterized protein n=1 Tax=Hyunsoonleella pacifica TaxID=1080224 RepID=A0A4Q9FR14_9FLAO|nr:hypothetical protein [Hyunsoonleella pacifica]TBN17507.1 hypothetical protein EYD46_04105 [Hyunsoonleella pacifica]GGD11418.1 hypothetical protein GCM10011368_11720 [Hyunsoonleella pacifica]